MIATTLTTERVWHDLHERLLRFIRARIADEGSAEDILQDVFLKIHARIDTLRDGDRLEGWVFQIVRNAIVDHQRSQRIRLPLPEDMVAPEDGEDGEDTAARRLSTSLRGMVEGLPEPYREALLLTEYGGLTQQELAARVGISLSGAKSRVQRARFGRCASENIDEQINNFIAFEVAEKKRESNELNRSFGLILE